MCFTFQYSLKTVYYDMLCLIVTLTTIQYWIRGFSFFCLSVRLYVRLSHSGEHLSSKTTPPGLKTHHRNFQLIQGICLSLLNTALEGRKNFFVCLKAQKIILVFTKIHRPYKSDFFWGAVIRVYMFCVKNSLLKVDLVRSPLLMVEERIEWEKIPPHFQEEVGLSKTKNGQIVSFSPLLLWLSETRLNEGKSGGWILIKPPPI